MVIETAKHEVPETFALQSCVYLFFPIDVTFSGLIVNNDCHIGDVPFHCVDLYPIPGHVTRVGMNISEFMQHFAFC